ncbi:hypothetical protein ACJJTC_016656 [Scirpophaga incertulas]
MTNILNQSYILYEKPPYTIKPTDFLKNLSPIIEGETSSECIKWEGKMLPDGFCYNIQTRETTDSNIITVIITTIKTALGKGVQTYKVNMKENSSLTEELLYDIIVIWESSDHNTFCFMDSITPLKGKRMKEALGIGRKGIVHSAYSEDMRQPEYKENVPLKYSPWIEEVFIRMAEDTQIPIGYTPCPELLKMNASDEHPLPYLCEPVASEMFSDILKTNAGVQLSKITNTYSRTGGAYGSGEIYGKEMFKNIAIFPIIATLSSYSSFEATQDDLDKMRLTSGFVVRAPYHARRPTDRIMMITVELMPKTDEAICSLNYINNCMVYETNNFLIVLRQNSVMKEDSTYNAFITTALFTPINMLGCLTLENPNIRREENMDALLNNTLERGNSWFVERAIEDIAKGDDSNSNCLLAPRIGRLSHYNAVFSTSGSVFPSPVSCHKLPVKYAEFIGASNGYHARNVQLITDADLNILHVDSTYGGATHDSFIFNYCVIKDNLEALTNAGEEVTLLGYSGYAQRAYLMTPISGAEDNSPEAQYNDLHSSARNSVERTIGLLKGRFRCLLVHLITIQT